MLNKIINFSIYNKFKVFLLLIALIVFGTYSLSKLPIDAVPDITNNQVQIITVSPALGASEIERFISMPLELATRNIPGIIEQRSFSRFGLNIITIVFNEKTDIYWARQQVGEKITEIKEKIPKGMGTPTLAPVTTGLGEIYQYVVKPKKGYENKYNLTELRTIQDWIIRKQLIGTEGVAEVSSFGGNLKQYEISLNPQQLKNRNITVADIETAIRKNNQNAGGAYIEKGSSVLFIRTEGLLNNIQDIENTVIKSTSNGLPILLKDIASVQIGQSIRYGAMTFNDEGEVAGAVVMMLKGANSNEVIQRIKEKITSIEKTLPEGIEIQPFLDRSKMVNKAISTVQTNLLEGALIVIFILVIFLGNLRAGFIVASVIPLSMLFAFIMMHIFGVSGNLMSLGALDFGLLVDGAVIIVEAVMHGLKNKTMPHHALQLSQNEMNLQVEKSSKKMMNSAVFGQIIILVVYLPILALEGIEGKMFKPMAQTVSFAIIGAFILSVTYVPMMTSLFLNKKVTSKDNFSDKMMSFFFKKYKPILAWALRFPKTIIAIAAFFLGISIFIASRLGGEFIPQLEEGDFAVSAVALTGSSLDNTSQLVQKAAGILKQKFPEVTMAVGKIGSSEVPTDPMPMEAADIMVILKDKKEWRSANSFTELAEKMSNELKNVPGLNTGFQYPVQMRFNELMTGARQDVVCKIFGENLDSLSTYANQLGKIIHSIEGAKDLYIETISGVQQIVIQYNRTSIASYGANIEDINAVINAAYAGAYAGEIMEGEKRFDLVLRMNENARKDINIIQNLPINTASGNQVPLHLLAQVSIQDGPYQIQRENAQRRIIIGFNVRGKDIETVVKELQNKAETQLLLPSGYHMLVGGQYENLQHATSRLSIAFPIALSLIFLMLFFALKKIKYCLLIFTAIPLSAIGGIIALWIRDMPFSISAGVGFIALFGVAVLNGIVLISEVNKLKDTYNDLSEANIVQALLAAAKTRLRPVLMTALVASLGFLPMALNTGTGGEVQRPLATVVIGGLFTSTLLTLLVLPALYLLIEKKRKRKMTSYVILFFFILFPFVGKAQDSLTSISLNEAIAIAQNHNWQNMANKALIDYHQKMIKTNKIIEPTSISSEIGQLSSSAFDTKFSINQTIALPIVYQKEKKMLTENLYTAILQEKIDQAIIIKEVKLFYLEMQFLQAKKQLLERILNSFENYNVVAKKRFEKGESDLLEKINLENQYAQLHLQLQQLEIEQKDVREKFAFLLNKNCQYQPKEALTRYETQYWLDSTNAHPYQVMMQHQSQIIQTQTELEQTKLLPQLFIGYNNQSMRGWQEDLNKNTHFYTGKDRFHSVQLGILLPLFNTAQKEKIKALKQMKIAQEFKNHAINTNWQTNWTTHKNNIEKQLQALEYYKKIAIPNAEKSLKLANDNYKNGAINYIEWFLLFNNAIAIFNQHIDIIKSYNTSVIELDYLSHK